MNKGGAVAGSLAIACALAIAACGAFRIEPSSSPEPTPEPTLKAVSRSSPDPEEALALQACSFLASGNGPGRGMEVVSRMAKIPVKDIRRYLPMGDALATESTQMVYVITTTGAVDLPLAGTDIQPLCVVVAGSPRADWYDLGDSSVPLPPSFQALAPDRVLPTLSP